MGDPTFMVMENLKRQFEQFWSATDNHPACVSSIDRLREDSAAERPSAWQEAYDIIAVDLPWLGEFVGKGVIGHFPGE